MDPFGFNLDATQLLVWGWVLHLVADWLLQSDWMAVNKMKRRQRTSHWRKHVITKEPVQFNGPWYDRHPAAFIHAGIHGLFLAIIFGWVAILLAISHLIIDTRVPVAWFAEKIRQTPPANPPLLTVRDGGDGPTCIGVDVGMLVRFNVDQVWHIVMIAIAALLVTL